MNTHLPTFALIVPTYNAASCWRALHDGIVAQNTRPDRVLILDSSSPDGTGEMARKAGFELITVRKEDFDHGLTRQIGAESASDTDVLLYMTQDAVPAHSEAFSRLLAAFRDPELGAAFGRQLPRSEARPIEAHARLFNYPTESRIRSLESRRQLGFKTIFLSNSFAAYRRGALMSVGGFPGGALFGEDTMVAARLHDAGWKTAYVAEAQVCHSHDYTLAEEFRRYFDIGAFHAREKWLIERYGTATGEGRRFVTSEMRYLLRHDRFAIPYAMARTIAKYFAYQAGKREHRFSTNLKLRLGFNREFWRRAAAPRAASNPDMN
ncbi:MAG TPA: glycosyltransferase family 2 protein [Terracidiphilus sp.]|nr:glycosyltransferase family 2 protein [Terracidiphilus sp.]